jgi:hypothetical protein
MYAIVDVGKEKSRYRDSVEVAATGKDIKVKFWTSLGNCPQEQRVAPAKIVNIYNELSDELQQDM